MSARNGGPAFPARTQNDTGANWTDEFGTLLSPDGEQVYAGMTLRDYFAARAPALPAPIRDAFVKALKRGDEVDLQEHAAVCARWSILYADAMLKERTA